MIDALRETKATVVAGGGDTLNALKLSRGAPYNYEFELDHESTGGGAMLEFIEGKSLPGIAALMRDNP